MQAERPLGGINFNDLTDRERAFIRDARDQAVGGDPNNSDPIIHSFDVSFYEKLRLSPSVGSLALEAIKRYPDVRPSHLRRRAHKTIMAVDMNDNREAMLGRLTKEAWDQRLEELAQDPTRREKIIDLMQHNVMSNVSERGKLLNAVIQLHGWGLRPLKIVDFGCSLNNNLKRLTMQHMESQHYAPVAVMDRVGRGNHRRRNEQFTERFNRLMTRYAPLIMEGVGVDVSDFQDPTVRHLAMTHRYPEEIADTVANAQFEQVTAHQPANIRAIQADARTMDPRAIGSPAHVAYMCTMLYQLPHEAHEIIQTAHESTTEDGLIVVQDFVKDYDSHANKFTFIEDKWPPYSYAVWVYDKARPDRGWQKHYTVDSGRVKALVIEKPVYEEPAAADWGISD
jgi:hypothetical protein